MIAAESIGRAPRPFRWSNDRYLALVNAAIIEEGPGVEWIDGQIVENLPQGELHRYLFAALQRAFASLGAFDAGLEVQPTVVLSYGNVFDPEFAFLRPQAIGRMHLPRGDDVSLVVEISVSSRPFDLGPKRAVYAAAGIIHYWVVDGLARGIHIFADPRDGTYMSEQFVEADGSVMVPGLRTLFLDQIFPPLEE